MANPFRRALAIMDGGMKPRAQFAAAASNRLLDDWTIGSWTPDALLRTGLRTLRDRSRQLVRDNAHAAAWVRTFTDNVVGADGIGIKPRMRRAVGNRSGKAGDLLDDYNLLAWQAFRSWGEAEWCTGDGHNDWPDVQRLLFDTWCTDGEVLARRVAGVKNPWRYELQLLDADLLDETYNRPPAQGENEIRMGVEVNAKGRAVAYHLLTALRNDLHVTTTRDRIRVPAEEILHFYVQLRPGQTRGIPPLTPVMIALHMLDTYTEAEIYQARLAASAGGFFETDSEAYSVPDNAPDGTQDNRIVMEAETGLTRQLPPGVRFREWSPTHPNANYEAFVRAILRAVARGGQMSYATFTGDLSDANYSSDRGGRLAERAGFKVLQRRFAARVLRPVYRDVLTYGSLAGAVQLPTPDVTQCWDCDYDFPGWPWVDPSKDIGAVETELRLKLTSMQRVSAERGRDLETIFEEIAEERRWAEKYGIDVADVYQAKPATAPGRPQNRAPSVDDTDEDDANDAEIPAARRALRRIAGSPRIIPVAEG